MIGPEVLPLLAALAVLAAAIRFLATLRAGLFRWAFSRLLTGMAAGLVHFLMASRVSLLSYSFLFPALVTLVELHWRRTGRERDLIEGMTGGVMLAIGTVAVISAFDPSAGSAAAPSFLISAVIIGSGIMFAAGFERVERHLLDGATLLVAVTVSATIQFLIIEQPQTFAPLTVGTGIAVALSMLIAFLARWRDSIRELTDEAELGLFDTGDVRRAANPFTRLFSRGGIDRSLRRRFVAVAQELAVRKNLQRRAEPQRARLLQLDILRLRMELRELMAIAQDLMSRARGGNMEEHDRSAEMLG